MNQATVDIEDPTNDDFEHLHKLISEFVKETGSVIGKDMVENWGERCTKFIKIFPKDYKAALAGKPFYRPPIHSVCLEIKAENKAIAKAKNDQQPPSNTLSVSLF